ncbi:DUF4828 domain-containing protein [Apilactobacillus ozensis]|uniref:DUF4828 domain-containing protein n=1 Tax=Apilactobacillus ozensis DSM 23829 = JCM 17196 TaxID=1423781 RepID=A0A0R2AMC5_9LACO|nr:DUF4828 domain-containing protein [Apilactobacillus ozensis]KRM68318.1 hypothetical protein FD06_GL001340 [Apilactobacillus ozensis DSM 23829 = JCM 17196]MCK8607492.1 DUF4828 domain-containing protein [Apilactobacillus ozensis]
MRKRNLVLIGATFFVGLANELVKAGKKSKNKQDSPIQLYYIGEWNFLDRHNFTHSLTINPDLSILLDNNSVKTKTKNIDKNELRLIDNFGYTLVVRTNKNNTPTSLYDEADDYTYNITGVKK